MPQRLEIKKFPFNANKLLKSNEIFLLFITALYGVLFVGPEATGGFSNYRLWESMGFIIAYILQTKVCIDVKLWFLEIVLLLGLCGYLLVEYLFVKREK